MKLIIFFAFLVLAVPSKAQEPALNGLIIDRTFTRFGKEFYRQYSQQLQDTSYDFNIVIEEKFLPRVGSLVTVSADNRTIFGRMLGRKNQELKQHVDIALNVTAQFIAQRMYPEINPDLKGDGFR